MADKNDDNFDWLTKQVPAAAGRSRIEWINVLLQGIESLYPCTGTPLESAHGNYRAQTVRWIARVYGSFAAVARILVDGDHVGSGFATRSSALGFPFDEIVVVTCRHLFTEALSIGAATTQPNVIEVCFDERIPRQGYEAEAIWESPVPELDVCVLRLKPTPDYTPLYHFEVPVLPLAAREPEQKIRQARGAPRNHRFVVLAQATDGEATATLSDNDFFGFSTRKGTSYPNFLHYNCPTSPGASGSAVLNEALEVVAVHRAGSATLADGRTRDPSKPNRNEGVSIQSVREAIKRSFALKPNTRPSFWSRLRYLRATAE